MIFNMQYSPFKNGVKIDFFERNPYREHNFPVFVLGTLTLLKWPLGMSSVLWRVSTLNFLKDQPLGWTLHYNVSEI